VDNDERFRVTSWLCSGDRFRIGRNYQSRPWR